MKLDDLNLFRLVVENGSYTATSRKTMIPVATITRRIQALEDSVNLRLLNRHARKLSLTEAGERFYKECSPLLQSLTSTAEEITDDCRGASGRIKISAPYNLTKRMMMPMFNGFMKQYPDINIELTTENNADKLDPTEWDVIFRVGPQRDSSLIARKVGEVKDILVASPDYLAVNPAPEHAEELSNHSLLKGYPLIKWTLKNSKGESVVNTDRARFQANALNVVRSTCSEGLGITLMPNVMVKEYIERGDLIRILPDWSANPRDIYMLYNHKDHLPEKVRLFIDYVIAYNIH
ncbi:LysR family transcriptional regulator [Vibrio natriegens]|uniref:LysR family transcriptional regulator n=1 Tax=Vibrio natriegens NBRC 15636 = ATCC 14048 = DSM 759 TaxID=1219067 RepID=A0AAN1CWD8_VIBNA|nr:LysR family transcriptional regulator [Vibrio natriegens]ALR14990.1 LysR family transcriptional regulator [Vibrio natriegens NBRC 15636 = ATCC 14048 = DSM 759]ANQ13146.1 LysR family transcriptional regulator [Vibrio natriegens NBRC 15636 = ATCC 14048 = DSM 759]EPM40620.1 LysR family transcriptional regulator [Vibrio natriegens NBRC 15636 = ATCC 14048 = DSM 759]MCG9700482.1 LysR family transcriptional regulator [Vibrio natriegens]MDX6027577.1 LysR family transcriptional regulator [Vibrio nat